MGTIFGDPGEDSGDEGKSKRVAKKIGEEKSKEQARAPGDKEKSPTSLVSKQRKYGGHIHFVYPSV